MRPASHPADLNAVLQAAGLRPTKQRKALAELLFDGSPKHLTAEEVYAALRKKRAKISLATVYNALHQFTEAGLLHEVIVEKSSVYFDTNTEPHHHFFDLSNGALQDIPADEISISRLPKLPDDRIFERIDVIIRLR